MIDVATSPNLSVLSHSDQGGRPDGLQIMVVDGYAYISHIFSDGFSVLDVRDPRDPRTVGYYPTRDSTWSIHLQAADGLLLVANGLNMFAHTVDEGEYYGRSVAQNTADLASPFDAGVRIYDISDGPGVKEVGFFAVDGLGVHRVWYTGGSYAYISAQITGYSDYILLIIDVSDPSHPVERGRWWLPGMWAAGGEEPGWPADRRYGLHHAIVADGVAYGAWRDGGFTLLDVTDASAPTLLSHVNYSPPFGGGTHTALPLPDRNLLLVADEAVADNCADQVKYTWVVDVRDPHNPVSVSTLPTPSDIDYCKKGGHFGPHNLHENRPGTFQSSTLIFATYQNAGLRVYDIANHFEPREVGWAVPGPPERLVDPRPGRPRVLHSEDVFVSADGIVYLSDANGGLVILEYKC